MGIVSRAIGPTTPTATADLTATTGITGITALTDIPGATITYAAGGLTIGTMLFCSADVYTGATTDVPLVRLFVGGVSTTASIDATATGNYASGTWCVLFTSLTRALIYKSGGATAVPTTYAGTIAEITIPDISANATIVKFRYSAGAATSGTRIAVVNRFKA
jgi:hypothetical protein